jgi:Peptidase dimerisation domain
MPGGICEVEVEVRCLERPVHSGQKGGPVPDPVQVLCRIIARLAAEDAASVRVIGFESQPVRGAAHTIRDVARARIAVRATGEPRRAGARVVAKLTRNPPCRAQVRAAITRCAPDGP